MAVKQDYSVDEIKAITEFAAEYHHNAEGFVKAAFPWGEDELKDKYPDEWQLNLLRDIDKGLKTINEVIQVAIASGHGIGKSALVSWLIIWAMATHEDTRGVVTANTKDQLVTKTWAELSKWHNLSVTRPLFTYSATAYYSNDREHEKTWRIDALPWSKEHSESFAGLHNEGKRILVIFDEASAIDDIIWEVIEGALTDSNTEIIWTCFGNPTRSSGRFFDCFHKYRGYWNTKQIDSRTTKVSNKAQLEKWIGQYGIDSDIIRVRVLGQFPQQSDTQLISLTDINAAIERGKTCTIGQYVGLPCIFGVDPAYTGGDDFIVYMRQGNYSKVIFKESYTNDFKYAAEKIARLQDEYNMTHGFIDEGMGIALYSYLRDMGRGNQWTLIPFGGRPNNPYYLNKRVEMWDAMNQWIKNGGALEDNQAIVNDLTGPESFVNDRGKLQLEGKRAMKERGLQSPNYADALALTFAQPIKLNQFDKLVTARRSGRIRKAGSM